MTWMPEYRVPWWLKVLRWFGLCRIKIGPFEVLTTPHIRTRFPKIDRTIFVNLELSAEEIEARWRALLTKSKKESE